MPLTTRCRHCGRIFPVHAQQLKERRGKVECPQCGGRFDAVRGLLDEAIPGTEMQKGDIGTGGSPRPAATTPADILDLSEGRRKRGRAGTALWSLGVLTLVAALLLQIGWWGREKWLQPPRVRVFAQDLCKRIGCRLELQRLAGTLEIMQPTLSEREERAGGLHLTMVLINKADVSQRLPQLQLELYDTQGDLTAARRFGPESYLPDKAPGAGLGPGESVRPTLDLEAPAAPAAGFRVKLF